MDSLLKPKILALILLGLSVVLYLGFFSCWNFKYLYYLRIPLIFSTLLLCLPILGIKIAPALLGSFFVLDQVWKMVIVIAHVFVVAHGLVLMIGVIGVNAPARFGNDIGEFTWFCELIDVSSNSQFYVSFFLGLPTVLALWLLADIKEASFKNCITTILNRPILGFFGGIIAAFLIFSIVSYLRSLNSSLITMFFTSFITALKFLGVSENGYLLDGGQIAPGHQLLGCYMVTTLVFYFVGFFYFHPREMKIGGIVTRLLGWFNVPPQADKIYVQLPILSYLLGILQIFSLFLGSLAFLGDIWLFPLLLFLLFISALFYFICKVDHTYDLKSSSGQIKKPALNETYAAINKRLDWQKNQTSKTLVVVCTSGGGIQATGWTTKVLTGLQEELGPKFTKSIGLISAVSGGSVGTMYFLDRFNQTTGAPDKADLTTIFEASTKDSLSVVGWGLVYQDILKLIGLPFIANLFLKLRPTYPRDRAAAINRKWKVEMLNGATTLSDWVKPIKEGKLPIPVFNATLVEGARQYLLSPMTFEAPYRQSLEFNTAYPNCDIDASTAALLSATFPYVTPITRNDTKTPLPQKPVFHAADGGFFDNFGVITAIDFLDKFFHDTISDNIKNIILVEIRAFPDEEPIKTAPISALSSWEMAMIGPFKTILDARNSTQAQRNEKIVKEFIEKWHLRNKTVENYIVSFPKHQDFVAPSFVEVSLAKTKYMFEKSRFSVIEKLDLGISKIEKYGISNNKMQQLKNKIKNAHVDAKSSVDNSRKELKNESYVLPLSWMLSESQIKDIDAAWNYVLNNPGQKNNKNAHALVREFKNLKLKIGIRRN